MTKGIKGSQPPCSVDTCPNVSMARGLCAAHYSRWRKDGDIRAHVPLRMSGDDTARYWSKVDKCGPVPDYAPHLGCCSLWLDKPDFYGYGHFAAAGQRWPAHRYAWHVIAERPLTPGLVLDHLCRVPLCVEPDHLEEVPIAENVRRGFLALITHCPAGHPYSGDNLYVRPGTGQRRCRTCMGKQSRIKKPQDLAVLVCPQCGETFIRSRNAIHQREKRTGRQACCSNRCAALQRQQRLRDAL